MLKGQALADAYAAAHPLSKENPGKVTATYDGGGWIVLLGSGLKPHPDLVEQFPNGWELFDRLRSGEARYQLETNFKVLSKLYKRSGAFGPKA